MSIKVINVDNTKTIKVNTAQQININMKSQEKSVIPTKEIQEVIPDENYNGLSKVVVDKIPNEYVIPNLQEKSVSVKPTDNLYVMADEGYDGLGVVNVIGNVDTENVEVTPTKELQTINRSEDKYIDSVVVNPIPDNYIEPSGTLDISTNGVHDTTNYESANVDVKPNVGTKTITENGVYNASDDNLDGYSSVNVETSGADLSEYFGGDINSSTSSSTATWQNTIKKLPALANTDEMQYLYNGFQGTEIDFSLLDFSKATTTQRMFNNCYNIETIDLSKHIINTINNTSYMLYRCRNLSLLDIRNFDLTNVTTYTNMFQQVNANCLIIVKDETQKNWMATNFSEMTNVKTVAEYEG